MYNPQLKTFLTVCDCGSFSKAANLLFLGYIVRQMTGGKGAWTL